jgi:opacity protein-like surface antigen
LQLGTDFGLQQHSDQQQSKSFSKTFAMLGTISYTLQDPWSLYGRLDYYNDPDAINSPLQINREGILTGYSTFGITAGVQYKPFDKMYLRLEGKRLNLLSEHSIFYWKGEQKEKRIDWILNMGVNF